MSGLFEFLFKYRLFLFQKGTIVFRPFWPWIISVILAGAALLAAYLLYRRAAGLISPGWRFALAGLRAAAFLLVLLIFSQPVLVLRTVIPQKSFVAIVYDLSKSMEIRDGAGGASRLEMEKNLLRAEGNPFLDSLGRKFKLRSFRFSATAERTAAFEDLQRHGNLTDLSRALEQAAGELGSAPVAGIVLVTDGADNHSSNLTETAARLRARKIPVYPVGIGSPSIPRDVEILRISAPRRVLKDSMVEADVLVQSSGYAGRRTRLVVQDRDRVLQSQEIALGSDGEVRNHKVLFTSDTAGSKVFSIRAEPFPDEIVPENNSRDVLISVVNEQPQILYVEGEPRWVYGFLRRAALEDNNIRLVSLLRQANGKLMRQGVESGTTLEKGFPADKAELFRYKGLILGSIEASFFSFDQLRLMQDFVGQRGGGLLMLGGRNSFAQGGYLNTPLEDVLPVNLRTEGSPEFQELEYTARLTSYGTDHPVTRLSLAEADNRKRWESAPALVGLNPTAGVKPGATVLAHAQAGQERGQGPVLLAFQRFGSGKAMALTTAATWRWRMQQDSRDNFHELFWKQMLRWLVSDAADPVVLEAEKHSYSPEEAVVLRGEVRDASFILVNNAQVSVQVKAPSGQVSDIALTWDVEREGEYFSTFKPLEQGLYEVSAEAFQGSKSLGKAKSAFLVAESTNEFHNAAMNESLLRRLAADTGGRYYSLDQARTLPEDITFVDTGAFRIEEKELWDMPILFLLLIGAAGSEWALRKKKGLA